MYSKYKIEIHGVMETARFNLTWGEYKYVLVITSIRDSQSNQGVMNVGLFEKGKARFTTVLYNHEKYHIDYDGKDSLWTKSADDLDKFHDFSLIYLY